MTPVGGMDAARGAQAGCRRDEGRAHMGRKSFKEAAKEKILQPFEGCREPDGTAKPRIERTRSERR